jgi:hypothetical protein
MRSSTVHAHLLITRTALQGVLFVVAHWILYRSVCYLALHTSALGKCPNRMYATGMGKKGVNR